MSYHAPVKAGAALLLILFLCACQLPWLAANPFTPANLANTVEAETRAVVTLTQASLPTLVPTDTLAALPTPTPTEVGPSATPTVTPSPVPSLTPIPTLTRTPYPCDMAGFVKDVTVPDGTTFNPGNTFTKIWRLRNIGTCTWTTEYALVFDTGDLMGGSYPRLLTASVAPGNTVDVAVGLTAPQTAGSYRGYWKLRNARGISFGTGNQSQSFYVAIKVNTLTPTTAYAFDFVTKFCEATWTNGTDTLGCSGTTGDPRGYVQRIDDPYLETGALENEPALLTAPQSTTNGYIRGKYPSYVVKNGDTFRTILGCAQNATSCNVIFELGYYNVGETAYHKLMSWNKVYDGKTLLDIRYDLSALTGKQVNFALTLSANGAIHDDRSLWLAPRILTP